MGGVLANFLGGSAAASTGEADSLSGSNLTVFHSYEKWHLHFNSSKNTTQLTVVDFAASWCGPCKLIEPAVEALSSKYTTVFFAKIDVDELSEVAQEFVVQAMPTFVLLKQGKEVERVIGAKPDELERKVQRFAA